MRAAARLLGAGLGALIVVYPVQHTETRLTGRIRARWGWFGKQVLQVEVATLAYSACPPRPGRDPVQWREQMKAEGETTCRWRDATWMDVAELQDLRVLGSHPHVPPRPMPAPAVEGVNDPPQGPRPPPPPMPRANPIPQPDPN